MPVTMHRPVPDYDDLYAGMDGSLVEAGRGELVQHEAKKKRGPKTRGYFDVRVGGRSLKVHQLVAAAFLGPCPPGMEVRHANGQKDDNRLENLSYGTHQENMQDAIAAGTHGAVLRQYENTLPTGARVHTGEHVSL